MRTIDIENVNVTAFDTMPTPEEIHARLPISPKATKTVTHGRGLLRKILERKDHRLFVVVGPCSIHDPVAGLDYARRLKALSDEVADTLLLVMLIGGSLLSGVNLFRQDPINAAEHLSGLPVLFTQGGLDRYVRRSELTKMVEQAGKTARLWYVDGAKHRDIEKTHPTEYLHNVIHFFQEAL